MATESTSDGPTKYKQIPLEMFGPKAADGSLSGFFDRTVSPTSALPKNEKASVL